MFTSARATSTPGDNVAVSPASVAFALAMLEPGTVGDAQTQLRKLLHIDDPTAFHAAMNALEQNLEAPVATAFNPGEDPGEITMRIANAAYLQKGYPFEPAYLQAVGSNYGPVLNEVDFSADPDAVAHQINAFVADATNDRIPQLVGDGVIDPLTVLALVNALYLKASWLGPFLAESTRDQPFTRLDGSKRTVAMMIGGSDSSAAGDGWIGATKTYVGGLTAHFILPDEGNFDEIANHLDRVVAEYTTNQISVVLDRPFLYRIVDDASGTTLFIGQVLDPS